MKLSQLLQAHSDDLVISPRHEAWLAQNPNASYTDKAKAFMAEEIGKPQRVRTGSFSASSAGYCSRRRQFEFLGMPRRPYRNSLLQVFHNGTYVHLRWQMAGLSEGWMTQAEVPVENTDLLLKGTMDGLLYDFRGLEIKSINSNGFRNIMQYGPKREHQYQVAAYVLSGAPADWVFLYEDKDTNEYKEFVFTPDKDAMERVRVEQEKLAEMTVSHKLAEIKDDCWAKQGTEYIQCPFRDVCLGTKSWDHASQQVSGSSGRKLRLRPTSSSPNA